MDAVNDLDTAQLLISLSNPADRPRQNGKTPLMLAVEHNEESGVKHWLEAGASIDTVDANGESALYKALNYTNHDFEVVEVVLLRARAETPTTHELVEKLLRARCTFPHAALVKDVNVLKNMLQRGFDVNSTNHEQRTALHYAALAKDFDAAKLLVDCGADVNARDYQNAGPLNYAAFRLDLDTVKLLLDHGADPDPLDVRTFESVPLYDCLTVADEDGGDDERVRECAEFLLQHNAFPRGSNGSYNLVYQVLDCRDDMLEGSRLNGLIAHQAMLDVFDEQQEEKEQGEEEEEHHLTDFVQLKPYYCKCRKALETAVVGTTSLLDLLHGYSEREMRLYARNQTFVSEMGRLCAALRGEQLLYYANVLMQRVTKAVRTVELENMGIEVICEMFQYGYNQLHVGARELVRFLSKKDLEQLCRVNSEASI